MRKRSALRSNSRALWGREMQKFFSVRKYFSLATGAENQCPSWRQIRENRIATYGPKQKLSVAGRINLYFHHGKECKLIIAPKAFLSFGIGQIFVHSPRRPESLKKEK